MESLRYRQIHLDFHTSERIGEVAHKFEPAEFASVLKKAHVNSVNCFAKCHHGMMYYDTRFPARHPGLKRNLLQEQIDACHAEGIKVPIYVSVGFDEYMAAKHPEWIQRASDGRLLGVGPLSAGWNLLCFNSPYADYLEEQTVEILETFDTKVDGFWFDILHQPPCYCSFCLHGMESKGVDPESVEEVTHYADQVLEGLKARLTAIIRKYNRGCSIFYNSGHVDPSIRSTMQNYTHLELESLASGQWGYEHFPITVRYAKNLGLNYLGMTGRFHKSWADFGGYKNRPALEYECYTILAHGAGCSIGDQLHPMGQMNEMTYDLIGGVFGSVKDKESWCDKVKPVSEIGVLIGEELSAGIKLPPAVRGVYRMLEEAHYQFDILDVEMDFTQYRLLILPDTVLLEETLKTKLDAYVSQGGKLLLSYQSGMDRGKQGFALENIGVEFVSDGAFEQDYVSASEPIAQGLGKTEYILYDRGFYVTPVGDTKKLASLWHPYFNRNYRHFCSHSQTPVERESEYPAVTRHDNIIYFSHPIFTMYQRHGMRAFKQLVLNCLDLLVEDRLVITDAPTSAHINLNYQPEHHRFVVHVLHYIPERRCEDMDVIEDVIPLYNVKLALRTATEPAKVYLAPSKTPVDFHYNDGYVHVLIPEVSGHQMVVFEL